MSLLAAVVVIAIIVLIWNLFDRIDELKAERDRFRSKEAQCVEEQKALIMDFERASDVLNERNKAIENDLRDELNECRKGARR